MKDWGVAKLKKQTMTKRSIMLFYMDCNRIPLITRFYYQKISSVEVIDSNHKACCKGNMNMQIGK